MNLTPIWGSLTVFIICPLLGGLPLIDWITYTLTGRHLSKLGTGNISVSAAFYHGGKLAGITAVLSEAAKGVIAVLLARAFFPSGSVWEIIAIIALVIGRYWMGKSAGTTNAVWGIVAHDPIAAALVWLISLISFTIIRDRLLGKYGALVLLTVIIALRNPNQPEYGVATFALASLLAGIYQNIPDDLDLASNTEQSSSNKMFRFFQGDKSIITLDSKLKAQEVGQKAANLALLKQLGYSVAQGWVLRPGDDLKAIVEILNPTPKSPLIVRSSAIGEDSPTSSAAGQYISILDVTNKKELESAIVDCQASYLQSSAMEYRRHQDQSEESMAVLIQRQIEGVYSGVAFSRDPVDRFNDSVVIEALPGKATKIVSGKFTPQRYRVAIPEVDLAQEKSITVTQENIRDDGVDIPIGIIESVALLAREMEDLFEGIPQDLEWTYDGEKIWLLQVRSITTLQPIWTRRIAAEVIPGKIRPLTWSINQPLTCGVWGKLFAVVLGDRARDLNFEETATLHFASAYFNVTLLGTIFRRMGLPPESLEFLTRGAKFSKPPLMSTIKNLPGLWRLLKREWKLGKQFKSDRLKLFDPILSAIEEQPAAELSPTEIIDRIDTILGLLDKVTYYNILAPLSLAIRQGILKVDDTELNYTKTPEVAAVSALAEVANQARKLLATEKITLDSCASLFAHIAENSEGETILNRFNLWLDRYGYLSEVATDIAIPRWRDKPGIPREMLAQFFFDSHGTKKAESTSDKTTQSLKAKLVQKRLNLKGIVAQIYNKLLANLRWSFLALEQHWLDRNLINNSGDIFFLELEEIITVVENPDGEIARQLSSIIEQRQQQWLQERELTSIPRLVYGKPDFSTWKTPSVLDSQTTFKGIGTSGGQIEGVVKIISSLQNTGAIDRQTIIIVPYTDAGWSPLLARAGGLISEVGGRLSHGAIVAREYNIPAVMDVANATKLFQDGQRVRINGQTGLVEILD
ncbi:glycerol-3-phosphate acyltransferase [Waterburya agarophytonicola K14]|uniref:Glycerol-3-phosphate acyltransferase n=1 Tax=Waterburya agarophytonicola KI4 TaxID=2874699 RepID=A0A964FKX9_9CYAN|nr:glycerol-3-phosphate acyltransferase [Waterburya agarophytonicola]MCC0179474.1 glycerol-3-phosphate acyltransferase [Waterburya agarophytonicola KI4]